MRPRRAGAATDGVRLYAESRQGADIGGSEGERFWAVPGAKGIGWTACAENDR